MLASQIFRQLSEFADGCLCDWLVRARTPIQAMVDMIMNERSLGIGDCAFNGVKLLRQIDTLPSAFDHRDDRRQMTIRAL